MTLAGDAGGAGTDIAGNAPIPGGNANPEDADPEGADVGIEDEVELEEDECEAGMAKAR